MVRNSSNAKHNATYNKPLFICARTTFEEGFLFYKKMNKLLEEENAIMKVLAEKHKEVYFELFGTLILEGMDIRTAIWHCWNKLECGGKNG
jgi:hypothetical protein